MPPPLLLLWLRNGAANAPHIHSSRCPRSRHKVHRTKDNIRRFPGSLGYEGRARNSSHKYVRIIWSLKGTVTWQCNTTPPHTTDHANTLEARPSGEPGASNRSLPGIMRDSVFIWLKPQGIPSCRLYYVGSRSHLMLSLSPCTLRSRVAFRVESGFRVGKR